jgi:hypothetical protein
MQAVVLVASVLPTLTEHLVMVVVEQLHQAEQPTLAVVVVATVKELVALVAQEL